MGPTFPIPLFSNPLNKIGLADVNSTLALRIAQPSTRSWPRCSLGSRSAKLTACTFQPEGHRCDFKSRSAQTNISTPSQGWTWGGGGTLKLGQLQSSPAPPQPGGESSQHTYRAHSKPTEPYRQGRVKQEETQISETG